MLSSIWWEYSDAYIIIKGTLTIRNIAAAGSNPSKRSRELIEIDHAKDMDVVW